MNRFETDVLVIGGGGAAGRAAISACDAGARVMIVTKKALGKGGATTHPVAEMAGYNAANPDLPGDVERHYQDIIDAGQGMADSALARILAENAPKTVKTLEEWGVNFETEGNRHYIFRSCFASSPRTHVIRGHGDPIMHAMINQIAKRPQIRQADDITIIELITEDNVCCGAWGVDAVGEIAKIDAGAVILGTGGASQAFEKNLNPADVSGDGLLLAYRAGAELINMEFMQVGIGFSHPVVNLFNGYIWAGHPRLINGSGEQFVQKYLPDDMTPEHVMDEHRRHFPFSSSDDSKYLEISIQKEILAGGAGSCGGIPIDMTHMTDSYVDAIHDDCGLHHMWRIAREHMRQKGVDLLSRQAEISVFAHATNGGVKINECSASTIPGLYAAGEVAGGPHGADRLGGNMMVTCQVFGEIAGRQAAIWAAGQVHKKANITKLSGEMEWILHQHFEAGECIRQLQRINQKNLLICRSEESLKQVNTCVRNLTEEMEHAGTSDKLNLENFRIYSLINATKLMTQAASRRNESRGAHFREDYPKKDANQSKPILHKR